MKCFSIGFAIMIAGSSLFGVPIFSIQSGGIAITGQNIAPAGTQADPWTFNETMTSAGIVALTDTDGIPLAGGVPAFNSGSWITWTVLNNSGVAWTSFEIELQQILGTPSSNGDGLSFGEGAGLVFSSDRFSAITRSEITRDYLNFSNGNVLSGESVVFRFAVTDNTPQSPIFLDQNPNRIDIPNSADIPEPASMFLLGSGLIASLCLRKRIAR